MKTSLVEAVKNWIIKSDSGAVKKGSSRGKRFHRESLLHVTAATAPPIHDVRDSGLIRRLTAAYQMTNKSDLGESMWKHFFNSYHEPIHEALMAGDEKGLTEIYRFPANNDLFYGFDIFSKSLLGQFSQADVREGYAQAGLDGLVRFAEATGAIPLDNPETWPASEGVPYDTEAILANISQACWAFTVPNPFPDEPGLNTSRGIVSRTAGAVSGMAYQATGQGHQEPSHPGNRYRTGAHGLLRARTGNNGLHDSRHSNDNDGTGLFSGTGAGRRTGLSGGRIAH